MRLSSRELFPTDDPVSTDRLIGRQADVDALTAALGQGLHRVIAGPRRTGKSSVARSVIERLRAQGSYAVAVNLFLQADAAAAAEEIADRAFANRPVLWRAVRRARQVGRAALEAASARVILRAQDELGASVEIALERHWAHNDPQGSFIAAVELAIKMAAADDRKLILFIDEFQELARSQFGDVDTTTKQLRSILEGATHTALLAAGSIEHMMRELFTDRQRGLYRFGGFHELSRITTDEWTQGLNRRFSQDNCNIHELALADLIAGGDSHPRATMLIAQSTHLASIQLTTQEIDQPLVRQGLLDALVHDRPGHEETLKTIRSKHRHTLAVALRIANNEPPYRGIEAKAANRAIASLREEGLIHKVDDSWRLIDPLLSTFIREQIHR